MWRIFIVAINGIPYGTGDGTEVEVLCTKETQQTVLTCKNSLKNHLQPGADSSYIPCL